MVEDYCYYSDATETIDVWAIKSWGDERRQRIYCGLISFISTLPFFQKTTEEYSSVVF